MRVRFGGFGRRSGYRFVLVAGVLGATGAACIWGRGILPGAFAQLGTPPAAAAQDTAAEWANRSVAVINHTREITMKDLGEYLIKREGAEKLELLVNKLIIEDACKKKGIEVTAGEVDKTLKEDLAGMQNITEKDFVNKVLRRYHKNLYEWKEDVIRPRLLMGKLCASRVKVTDEDLRAAYEAYYGEKVECRLIMFPREEKAKVLEMYATLRDNPQEFEKQATHQASSQLAATGGLIKPFGRHTTGNEELEREAFSMNPGDMSRVIETPEGLVIVKLVKKIPADTSKKFDDVRATLAKEVTEKKIKAEIPVCFKELRDKAEPILLMKKVEYESDQFRDVQREVLGPKAGAGASRQN